MFGFWNKKKTAVMIIPPKQFDGRELLSLNRAFKQAGIKGSCASTHRHGPLYGLHNEKIKPCMTISEIELGELDALILIGGLGAMEYYNDHQLHHLLQSANRQGKILGAIDYSPIILAHAEILRDRKATVYQTEIHKLEAAGAIYTGNDLEMDGNIVTANAPDVADEFSDIIAGFVLKGYQNGVTQPV